MDKVYLRFPSGRTFLLLDDIVSIKDEKRLFFVFWNEESLKTNFHIETKAGKPSCYSFYASPTKIGVKNITAEMASRIQNLRDDLIGAEDSG